MSFRHPEYLTVIQIIMKPSRPETHNHQQIESVMWQPNRFFIFIPRNNKLTLIFKINWWNKQYPPVHVTGQERQTLKRDHEVILSSVLKPSSSSLETPMFIGLYELSDVSLTLVYLVGFYAGPIPGYCNTPRRSSTTEANIHINS